MALSSEPSLPILHAYSYAGEAVVLGNRNIDDLIDIQERIENLPGAQNFPLQVYFLESRGIRKNDLRACVLCRLCDARSLKAAARIVAAHVSHDDPLCSRVRALPYDFRDYVRIGVGRLFGRTVPANVRLHQDYVPARDEAAHAR